MGFHMSRLLDQFTPFHARRLKVAKIMKVSSVLAIATLVLGLVSCGGDGDTVDEETVEMISGSYRTVADGRAEILIGRFGDQWREDLGLEVDAVEVKVTCAEEEVVVWVFEDQPTQPVCRVQLQVVEFVTWTPPKVRVRVIWTEP